MLFSRGPSRRRLPGRIGRLGINSGWDLRVSSAFEGRLIVYRVCHTEFEIECLTFYEISCVTYRTMTLPTCARIYPSSYASPQGRGRKPPPDCSRMRQLQEA